MQPCAAQCCWSARISSWKVIAKRGAPYTPERLPSVDAHAAGEVHALQPAAELRLDEPGEEGAGLGPERRRERLPRTGLDRRQPLQHCRVDGRSRGPGGAAGAHRAAVVHVEAGGLARGTATERA